MAMFSCFLVYFTLGFYQPLQLGVCQLNDEPLQLAGNQQGGLVVPGLGWSDGTRELLATGQCIDCDLNQRFCLGEALIFPDFTSTRIPYVSLRVFERVEDFKFLAISVRWFYSCLWSVYRLLKSQLVGEIRDNLVLFLNLIAEPSLKPARRANSKEAFCFKGSLKFWFSTQTDDLTWYSVNLVICKGLFRIYGLGTMIRRSYSQG
ncbi:hypothetical protein CUMW_095180 [Citrus unshiu]|uniref:Uncharacterized protein n=1 Tax=Citrus unshiu TaxID=55188 RepID=A0A2H5P1F7_CITUN|nr:hypothetical protein CUMW_095180 [Citrus unshiu]